MSPDRIQDDEPALRTIAMPADTNPNGDIFGGWLMSQMDLAGSTTAIFRADGRVATVAVDGMEFHEPVLVGDEVSCYTNIKSVGDTSLTVNVVAFRRDRGDDELAKVTEGLFTYVAIDNQRNPRPITPSN